jgi:transcriptional regulator with XRE-family HTH domain
MTEATKTQEPPQTGNAIALVLKKYRKRSDMTQSELSARTDVKREYISSMELGRIQVIYPQTFVALRRALNFPGYELLEAMGYPTDGDGGSRLDGELVRVLRRLSPDQQRAIIPFAMAAAALGTSGHGDGSGG